MVDRFPKFPQHVEARYGLAFALQNQKKFDPARSHYQQVIKDTETETAARARFMLGECDFAEQKFDSAWEHYLEAALGYPYEEWKAQGHYQAARCFVQLEKTGESPRRTGNRDRKIPAARLGERRPATAQNAPINNPQFSREENSVKHSARLIFFEIRSPAFALGMLLAFSLLSRPAFSADPAAAPADNQNAQAGEEETPSIMTMIADSGPTGWGFMFVLGAFSVYATMIAVERFAATRQAFVNPARIC